MGFDKTPFIMDNQCIMADLDTKNEERPASGGGSFLMSLLDFILGRESDPQRRELQAVQKQLNRTGYKFYKLSKERLLAPFASFIYEIYEIVDPLREFFLENTTDKYYAHAVIEYFKTEKINQLAETVSEESLVESSKGMEFPGLAEAARKNFNALTATFGKDLAGKVNAMYNSVIALKQFCLIDYYIILRRFKPDLEEHKFIPHLSFGQIAKKSVIDIVPDFLAAAVNLLCVDDWTAQMEFISTLPGFKGFEDKKLEDLHDKLLKMNSLSVFANFGKLFLHDPSYTASANFPAEDIVKDFLDGISHEMEETLQEIDIRKKNELLEIQMKEIFGGAEIMDLQNYTEDSSDILEGIPVKLEDGKQISYNKCMQAKYFHSLVNTYLSKKLLEFVENFAVRAEIRGSEYTAKFSSEYHQMLAIDDEIKKLDMELGQGFPNGYKIALLADAAAHSSDAAEKLYTEVSSVNKAFADQLGEGMGILHSVLRKLTELLEDKKSISPAIVKNWNNIDEYLREPALKTLTESTTRLKTFVALMDSFK